MYNLFFSDKRAQYVLRMDFESEEELNKFLSSKWFSSTNGLTFRFILKDGKEFIKGKHLRVSPTEKDFEQDMKFSLLVTDSEYPY